MSEIKVQIKGDDEDFKRKMAESGAEARHFAEQVKESFDKGKDAAADMLGEAGFGGIKKVLTGAGVVAFGAGIIEAFKRGAEAAIDFEDKVSKLKSSLGVAQAGMAEDVLKWVEAHSGAMSSVEETGDALQQLTDAKIPINQAQNMLLDLQNAARATHGELGELTHAFVEMKTLGEVPARFFKEHLTIAAIVKGMVGPALPPKPGETPQPEEEGLAARVKARGGAEWMLTTLLPSISPGGMQSRDRIEAEATTAGQLKNLGVQFEEVSRELGTALLPTIKEFVGDIRAAMPEITETVRHWSEDLKELLDSIHKNLGWLGRDIVADRYPGQRTVEGLHDKLASIVTGHMESVIDLKSAAQEQRAAAEALHRAVNPIQ